MRRLFLLQVLLLVAPARAGEPDDERARLPHLCVSTWQGPTPSCPWRGEVQVSGAGRTEERARKAAFDRLRAALLGHTRSAWESAQDSLHAMDLAGLLACARTEPEDVSFTCIPQPLLALERTCYSNLTADPCWDSGLRSYEGTGWVAQELARTRTCEEVGRALAEKGEDTAFRMRCEARCLAEVRVLCQ